MRIDRLFVSSLVLLILCGLFGGQAHGQSDPEPEAGIEANIARCRSLLARSDDLKKRGDIKDALVTTRTAFETIFAIQESARDKSVAELYWDIGLSAHYLNDIETSSRAWRIVTDFREATCDPDDPALLAAKLNLATAVKALGEYGEALPLEEDVVEAYERIFSEDNYRLQVARTSLAYTLRVLGNYDRARSLQNRALAALERILPDDHPTLQGARMNHAVNLTLAGDYRDAQVLLKKNLLIDKERLPPDHIDILKTKTILASTYKHLGDLETANRIQKEVIEGGARTLPPDNLFLRMAKSNYAQTLHDLGDWFGARSIRHELVEFLGQSLPENHPDLMVARANLALTYQGFGDYHAAKALLAKQIDIYGRDFPADHLLVVNARESLATVLDHLDEFRQAKALREENLKALRASHPEDHHRVRNARDQMAASLHLSGENEEARESFEAIVARNETLFASDHPKLQSSRIWLAQILKALREFDAAMIQEEMVLKAYKASLPPWHPKLQIIRQNLSTTLSLLDRKEDAFRLASENLEGARTFITRQLQCGVVREIDETVANIRYTLDRYVSLASGGAASPADVLSAVATFKAAGIRTALVRRILTRKGGPGIKDLQNELSRVNLALAEAGPDELIEAVRARDNAERKLAEAVAKLPGAQEAIGTTGPHAIAASLPEGWTGISFLRYKRQDFHEKKEEILDVTPSYLALIVESDGTVDSIDLGPAEAIDSAADQWYNRLRENPATGQVARDLYTTGQSLRKLLWDPLRKKIGDSDKIVLAPDSMLATIPFEAFPDDGGVLADQCLFVYTDSLASLTIPGEAPGVGSLGLVAMGGVDYDAEPRLFTMDRDDGDPGPRLFATFPGIRSSPRGNDGPNADPLPGSGAEVETIAALYSEVHGEKSAIVRGPEASKETLIALAPSALYLHVATHGYFSSEKVLSAGGSHSDVVGSDTDEWQDRVTGLAPSLLCGLKFAGCNLSRKDSNDRGVITAEEIQWLDLSGCQLAVLSACETNLGMVRAGLGIMSLQRALRVAGARGTITSLWKVDDQASRLFFSRFYSILWKENLHPAAALRKTRQWLRDLTASEATKLLAGLTGGGERGTIRKLESDRSGVGDRPFASPYYWASFIYMGGIAEDMPPR